MIGSKLFILIILGNSLIELSIIDKLASADPTNRMKIIWHFHHLTPNNISQEGLSDASIRDNRWHFLILYPLLHWRGDTNLSAGSPSRISCRAGCLSVTKILSRWLFSSPTTFIEILIKYFHLLCWVCVRIFIIESGITHSSPPASVLSFLRTLLQSRYYSKCSCSQYTWPHWCPLCAQSMRVFSWEKIVLPKY